MDCYDCLARFGLFIFNFIFILVFGLGVIFVGILIHGNVSNIIWQPIVTLDSGDYAFNTASTILIIFGVVILLCATFGFFFVCPSSDCCSCGPSTECCCCGKKLLGGLYIFFLSLVLIVGLGVEITAAVVKGSYLCKQLDDQLPDILQKSLGSNYKDGNNLKAKAWDFVQVSLICCGSKGPQDYSDTIFNDTKRHVPDTCCVPTNNDWEHIDVKNYFACQLEAYQIQQNVTNTSSDFINKEGCFTSFESQINGHLAPLVGVGVGIVILELLGILLACYVCRKGDDNDDDNISEECCFSKFANKPATAPKAAPPQASRSTAAPCDGPIRGEKDYEPLNAPHCFKCDAAIIGESVIALNKQYHPACFLCYHCNQPIRGPQFQPAMSNNYHSECFNCSYCGVNLEGQAFYPKEGMPFCEDHAR